MNLFSLTARAPAPALRLFTAVFALLCVSPSAGRLSAAIADQLVRSTAGGIDIIAYPTAVKDVVTLRGSLPAGDGFSPSANLAIATLVAGMLDQGTTTRDKFAIAQELDAVGATLSFSAGDTMVTFQAKCLSKDLSLIVDLLAEQLRAPAFAETELAKLKKQRVGELRRSLEQPGYRASQALAAALYPPDHPNHKPSAESMLAAIEAATIDELRAFHRQHYGPARLTLIAVGDLDPVALQTAVTRAFAGWSGGVERPAYPRATTPASSGRTETVVMGDKPNVSVIFGQTTGLRHSDPDSLPLRVATAILGSGFTGRLMSTVRDKEGLTYGIGASLGNDTFADGDWRIAANFAPELLEKGLASTRRELKSWHEQGVTVQEVERVKTSLAGAFQVKLATTDGLASTILDTLHRGYTLDRIDAYPTQLAAVTPEEVNTVIRKHIRPGDLVLIQAGTLPSGPQVR